MVAEHYVGALTGISVVVQGALREPGPLGDLVHRRPFVAVLEEQGRRGLYGGFARAQNARVVGSRLVCFTHK